MQNFESNISHFRFVVTPFGIPSVTDLLGQVFTAVTGRSVQGFENYIQFLTSALIQVSGAEFFKKSYNLKKRSMADISNGKMFGELKETAESVPHNVNICSLTNMFNADSLELGEGNLPPGSVLSLASVIGNTHHGVHMRPQHTFLLGMAMLAQYISIGRGPDEEPSGVAFRERDRISERKLFVRRQQKKRRYPYYKSEKDFPHLSGNKKRYFYHNNIQAPVMDVPAIDDFDEDIEIEFHRY
jgi:hypothetical protein